jgi:hypothetical protein
VSSCCHEFAGYLLRSLNLSVVLELHLPGNHRKGRVNVADTRDGPSLLESDCSSLGIRYRPLKNGDRHPLRDARTLVDPPIFTGQKRHPLNRFGDEVRDLDWKDPPVRPCFLGCDFHPHLYRLWIVRPNLCTDPILERSNDLPAGRVILRVCGEHEKYVEEKTNGIPSDLNVPLLKDVKEPDLNLP